MAIQVTDRVRCVARMSDINGSLIENAYVLLHAGSAEVSNSAFLTAIEARLSAMYADIEAMMPNTLTPTDIVCDLVEFEGGVLKNLGHVGTIAWTTWSGGTGTGEGLPQGNAAVVNFPTASVGVQGRKYLGPFVENQQANGILESTFQSALATFAATLLSELSVGGQAFNSGVMSSKTANFVAYATAVIKAVVGYQRRRKSGVGA